PLAGPERPTPAGLAAAVADWSCDPPPLVALYLRRPDAKPLAARR
ncbi:tRNA (adenosine(37)-N6)-threonylcarbamoyltransferase complex dimerization subunit type 1 TsaB, partial [Mycobacterium palustre]|nr:tRNA (adenosine(37)-N6)-threonylcarbamoyltransferase complex dimerization subunit type 1 TsaB [Mycobacterium palustre]